VEFDALRFREVMSRFATGVSVVTTFEGEGDSRRPAGITVNALSSVSLDPPLVMVALDRGRFITPMVRANGRYAVNVLGDGQQALSDCFAHGPAGPGGLGREDFCGASWQAGATGLPLIDGAIATLECTVLETFSAGDHDLFVARVDNLAAPDDPTHPLLFFRRQYVRVAPRSASTVEGKQEG
jgi:3-hydroxy-9,10-secoandrosta-1,3,5(10)-triene-9,17-dione monooxygenase reductase component